MLPFLRCTALLFHNLTGVASPAELAGGFVVKTEQVVCFCRTLNKFSKFYWVKTVNGHQIYNTQRYIFIFWKPYFCQHVISWFSEVQNSEVWWLQNKLLTNRVHYQCYIVLLSEPITEPTVEQFDLLCKYLGVNPRMSRLLDNQGDLMDNLVNR